MSPQPDSRRNFVKKSIVTTIALSQPALFSGLVRATGWEGDTTGEATTSPETTWVYETTCPWSDQETTVPWGGSETTVPYTETMPPGSEFTYPETTVPESTYYTTVHCRAHGSHCTYVSSISIVFTAKAAHPQPNHPNASGDVYTGTMTYTVVHCDGDPINVVADVSTGGYRIEPTDLAPGSQTGIPAGSYNVGASQTGGSLPGYAIGPNPPGRSDLELHEPARPNGSSGCIAFATDDEWETYRDLVNNGNKANCVHNPPRPIPMTVAYQGVAAPTYTWKPGKAP